MHVCARVIKTAPVAARLPVSTASAEWVSGPEEMVDDALRSNAIYGKGKERSSNGRWSKL